MSTLVTAAATVELAKIDFASLCAKQSNIDPNNDVMKEAKEVLTNYDINPNALDNTKISFETTKFDEPGRAIGVAALTLNDHTLVTNYECPTNMDNALENILLSIIWDATTDMDEFDCGGMTLRTAIDVGNSLMIIQQWFKNVTNA